MLPVANVYRLRTGEQDQLERTIRRIDLVLNWIDELKAKTTSR